MATSIMWAMAAAAAAAGLVWLGWRFGRTDADADAERLESDLQYWRARAIESERIVRRITKR